MHVFVCSKTAMWYMTEMLQEPVLMHPLVSRFLSLKWKLVRVQQSLSLSLPPSLSLSLSLHVTTTTTTTTTTTY